MLAVVGLCAVVAASFASLPALAHHSFGHYDMEKTAEIEGTVHKYEWTNPHCWLFVDVASANGATVTYGFELSSVGEMLRRGWKKTSVKFGDKVKVKFRPMRDGTPAGLMMGVEKDGNRVGVDFGGSAPAQPLR
jgi:hypothetical protein